MASKKSEGTAQRHVLLVRGEIEKLLPNPMDTITPVVPENEEQWKKVMRIPPQGHGWRYARKEGQLCVRFENPILWQDVQKAFYVGLKKGELTAETSAFMAKWEGYKKKAGSGDSIGEDGSGHSPKDVIVGTTRVLTRTSKMGCYSWNLPAGPPKFHGCCPGANMAFDVSKISKKAIRKGYDRYTEDALSSEAKMRHVIEQATRYGIGYEDAIPKTESEIIRKFICNGCYAMKGAYGNPSVITIMQWRYMWLRYFAIPTGNFVDTMIKAIRMAQKRSRYERARAGNDPRKLAAIPHPDYFRIHDSGDMWKPEYMGMWLEICDKMPDIHFWAPTRVWTTISMAEDLERLIASGKLPKNLSLRPSGLFFDGPDPQVPGLDGGTSANTITYEDKNGKIKLDIAHTGPKTWGCPAYLPEVIGGGALPILRTSDEDDLSELQVSMRRTSNNKRNKYFEFKAIADSGILASRRIRALVKKYPEVVASWFGGKGIEMIFKPLTAAAAKRKYKPAAIGFKVISRRMNPVDLDSDPEPQAYAMYPNIDESTPEDKRFIFYNALFDTKTKRFVLDPVTGRPMRANDTNKKKYPKAIVMKSQTFQAAGSCSVARDPNQAEECRVCWGTTGNKRSMAMKKLPVVYGKH